MKNHSPKKNKGNQTETGAPQKGQQPDVSQTVFVKRKEIKHKQVHARMDRQKPKGREILLKSGIPQENKGEETKQGHHEQVST